MQTFFNFYHGYQDQFAYHPNMCYFIPVAQNPPPQNQQMMNQNPIKCAEKPHSKHKFTEEEDKRLRQIVAELGEFNWKRISEEMGTRNYRQCRERWKNYLSPNVKKDPWTKEEDSLLMSLYETYGSQWTLMAKHFQNRTDVNLKNRWVVLSSRIGPMEKRIRKKTTLVPNIKPKEEIKVNSIEKGSIKDLINVKA